MQAVPSDWSILLGEQRSTHLVHTNTEQLNWTVMLNIRVCMCVCFAQGVGVSHRLPVRQRDDGEINDREDR